MLRYRLKPAPGVKLPRVPLGRRLKRDFQRNRYVYLMLIPVLLFFILFRYGPMKNMIIAFQDYKPAKGIAGSRFVGFKNFETFFKSRDFFRLIRNTLLLSLYSIVFHFPLPILLALMINEVRHSGFKRVVQTVLYAPHFISIMVVCGMIRIFLSPSGGLINLLIGKQIDFLTESSAFRTIYIASGIWQDAGWGCIIYLATLSNVDTSLYEAAKVDGASMFQRIMNVDVPALLPMAILNLIMSAGSLMNVGFEKVWLLQTDLNKATSDVIAVYVYQQGIENAKYSYSTAVGLFNTAVNLVLLFIVNTIASKTSEVNFV